MSETVCFFAKVHDPAMLDRIEFYAQDIRILRDLGYRVSLAVSPWQLTRADIYFVWWWTWAFAPDSLPAASLVHQQCPDVRFVIVGEKQSDYPALEQLAKELNATDYIAFPGAVSLDEKIERIQHCTVYLQPSRFEGFGLAILEAM